MGPPLAGKKSALREFAANEDQRLNRFAIPGDQADRSKVFLTPEGEPIYMTSSEYRSSRHVPANMGAFISIERGGHTTLLATLSGVVWTEALWEYYAANADGVGLVLDSQDTCGDKNCAFIDALDAMPKVPDVGCVLWNKQDLTHKAIVSRPMYKRLQRSRGARWPVFPSSRFDRPSVLKAIDWLIDRVWQP
jgi:hypothetical protein